MATVSLLRLAESKLCTPRNPQPDACTPASCLKDETGARAWQAVWNMTGTSLTTAGDDGAIRIWGTDYDGNWSCYDILQEASLDRKPATAGDVATGAIAAPPPLLPSGSAVEEG